jgi:hypothetical protein
LSCGLSGAATSVLYGALPLIQSLRSRSLSRRYYVAQHVTLHVRCWWHRSPVAVGRLHMRSLTVVPPASPHVCAVPLLPLTAVSLLLLPPPALPLLLLTPPLLLAPPVMLLLVAPAPPHPPQGAPTLKALLLVLLLLLQPTPPPPLLLTPLPDMPASAMLGMPDVLPPWLAPLGVVSQ